MSERFSPGDPPITRRSLVGPGVIIRSPRSNSLAEMSEPDRVAPLDFLDFQHPIMRARAQEKGFENGRVFIDRKLYGFLIQAKDAGVVQEVVSNINPDRSRKVLELAWFCVCSDALFPEIFKDYGYRGRNGARDLVVKFFSEIYRNSPEEIQSTYPNDRILLNKKQTQRHADLKSALQGGRRREARELIASGITNPKEIALRLQIPVNTAINMFVTLRKQNVVQKTKRPAVRRARERVHDASTVHDFRAILNGASDKLVRSSTEFSSLSRILRGAGYHVKNKDIPRLVAYLSFSGVPMRNVRSVKVGIDGEEVVSNATYFLTKQGPSVLAILRRTAGFNEIVWTDSPEE